MVAKLDKTIAIVGGGTMGAAVASGLASTGTVEASRIHVADHNQGKRDRLAALGIQVTDDASALSACNPDVVVLAVKPQVLSQTILPLCGLLAERLVISVAAGVSVGRLEELMPKARVVRAMPNLPVQVLSGASAICAGPSATSGDVELARQVFGCLGVASVMREDQLDAEGAVVSCGPAYVALFADLLTRAGVEHGLAATDCRQMVLHTMRGVAEQLLGSGSHPRAYMEGVTSPGGTTAAGLRVMEPLMFDAVGAGVDAALARTDELAGTRGE